MKQSSWQVTLVNNYFDLKKKSKFINISIRNEQKQSIK